MTVETLKGTSKNPILSASESFSAWPASRKSRNIHQYAMFSVPGQPKKSSTLRSKAIIRGTLNFIYKVTFFAKVRKMPTPQGHLDFC